MATSYYDALLLGERDGVLHAKVGQLMIVRAGKTSISSNKYIGIKGVLVITHDDALWEFFAYQDQSLIRFPELDDSADAVCTENDSIKYSGWKNYLHPQGFLWPVGHVPCATIGAR